MMRLMGVVLVLALAGCGSSLPAAQDSQSKSLPKRGTAEPANQLVKQDLIDGAVRIDVPAGEWRILHLDWSNFAGNGEDVQVLVASEGSPGAHPWGGFGDQAFFAETGEPLVSSIYLNGFRSGEPDSYGFQYSFTGNPSQNYTAETVYIVGSNDAPSTFYIGVVPNIDLGVADSGIVLPETTPGGVLRLISGEGQTEDHRPNLEELKQRTPVTAHLESGSGGFGVTYKRYYAANGDLIEVQAGRALFSSSVQADPGFGAVAERALGVQVDEALPGKGLMSLITIGRPQAGSQRWTYQLNAPGLNVSQTGISSAIAGFSGGVNTGGDDSTKVGGNLATIIQGPVEAGPLDYDISYIVSGREGGGVNGNASGALYPTGGTFYSYLGYINADFSKLYGWNVTKSVMN